jgi:hypothetical protein
VRGTTAPPAGHPAAGLAQRNGHGDLG